MTKAVAAISAVVLLFLVVGSLLASGPVWSGGEYVWSGGEYVWSGGEYVWSGGGFWGD